MAPKLFKVSDPIGYCTFKAPRQPLDAAKPQYKNHEIPKALK